MSRARDRLMQPAAQAARAAGKAVMNFDARIMADARAQPSFGGEMKALFRLGRNDLADAILKAFPDSPGTGREVGVPGSPTQVEVFRDRKSAQPQKQAELEMGG